MTGLELVAVALAVFFACTDWLARRAPWFIAVPAAIAGVLLAADPLRALAAAVVAGLLIQLAGFPGVWSGDSKAASAIAPWLAFDVVVAVLVVAFVLTHVTWSWGSDRQRPWLPVLLAALLLTFGIREGLRCLL